MIECSFRPSGVPSCALPIQVRYCGSSLMQENGSQVAPASVERNNPCGDVPAYQTSSCEIWPGVSQNVWSTVRPGSPAPALAKAGGRAGSFQLAPRSVGRNILGAGGADA